MKKDIIILTRSSKHGGYCVAGIDKETNKWVRLVGSEDFESNEIPKSYMNYSDEKPCLPLDIATVEVIKPLPGEIQLENVVIDINEPPVFKDRVTPAEIEKYLSNDKYIYGGDFPNTYRNKAIEFGHSLAMYKVQDVSIEIFELESYVRKKVSFKYNGFKYNGWAMTDPDYYDCEEGKIYDEALIVVSLAEEDYNGYYYKFVSKIIGL